ncbi:MAG: hypothetical protein ACK462_10520, partial [Planctomyces sp.]
SNGSSEPSPTNPAAAAAHACGVPGTDVNLPVVGLPGTPHAWAAAAAGFVGLGSLLPFDQGQAFMAQEDTTADTRKAQQHLGFKPVPFVPTLKAYAPAMATH